MMVILVQFGSVKIFDLYSTNFALKIPNAVYFLLRMIGNLINSLS